MGDKIYKITLTDGTVINDLKLNGNNFISSTEIEESVFDGNLLTVTINDGEKDEIHTNMELVQISKVGSSYWFVLRDIPETELAFIKMQSDIEYVAMMSEIELYGRIIEMAEHSKNYDKVKRYYNMGMWNETRVRNAVKMNWITEEEFKEITDKEYA